MREFKQLYIGAKPEWGKWPTSDDTDFSELISRDQVNEHLNVEGESVRIITRTLPIHSIYSVISYREKPPEYPAIDNTLRPHAKIEKEQERVLSEMSQGMDGIYWDHVHHCHSSIAHVIPNLAPVRVINFADDCPNSSEHKTIPVAKYFTDLIHSMNVWDFGSGKRVSDLYAENGLSSCYFAPNGRTAGLDQGIDDIGFDFEERVDRIERGIYPKIDLGYVGLLGGNKYRRSILRRLAVGDIQGISVKAYGFGFPGGELGDRRDPLGCGYFFPNLYSNVLFGLNAQMSSLFNTRLMDLWYMGVAQLIHDPHGEMGERGFLDGIHYIEFDGSAEDMREKILDWKSRPKDLAQMLRKARKDSVEFLAEHNSGRALARIYLRSLNTSVNDVRKE